MKLRDPLRLADDAGSGELAEAIRASRQLRGSPQQVGELAARVAPFAGAELPSVATASALSPLAKAVLGGAVVVAAGLAFWLAAKPSVEAPSSAASHAPAKVKVVEERVQPRAEPALAPVVEAPEPVASTESLGTGAGECASGACLVYQLRGDPSAECVPEPPKEGDPGVACTQPDEAEQRVYCSCRCSAPEGDPGELCTCPDEFTCVDGVVPHGPPGVRGGYCVRNDTFTTGQ